MRRFIPLVGLLFFITTLSAQTPVPMASQPGLSYTEDFSDIVNWTNNFAAGIGASRFGAVAVNSGSPIPSGNNITANVVFQSSLTSGGIQKGSLQVLPTNSIVLLTTGTTDNTTSTGFDILLDFTSVDAGTLSFDWAIINNGAGGRNSSLKIYSSTDGISFTEITGAAVNNFTNNASTSGTISAVSLPALFNGAATARLRFYYHNGTGGASGSRPKISIDNIVVTAVATTPCVTPTAQPTALNFGTITSSSINGSYTAASPPPNGYLVVASNNINLTSLPVDGTSYSLGDNIGDGFVVANGNSLSFSATGLSASTTYNFFIFSVNDICFGGVKYLTTGPLQGSSTTAVGQPACIAPTVQPTNLSFGTTASTSIQSSFTITAADGYLVLRSTSASLSSNPANGNLYTVGDIIGNATVVQQNNFNSFTATGLSTMTLYYFYIFSYNNSSCSGGPAYFITAPLSGSHATAGLSPCSIPTGQPSNLLFTIANTSIAGSFSASSGNDAYLVIRSLNPTLSATPVNNTDYLIGDPIGGGTVIDNSANRSFVTTGLTPVTTYYFYAFSVNKNCSGGTKYLTTAPLENNASTTNAPINNYYFGNLHSHSDYSDGNQDNPGYTPADNYLYAYSSQCMDFLGVSEHNHYSGNNSPGNILSNYTLGASQASSFTASNPGFVALYGMEWGVISNGGHVLIYGDGMNNLWGWESGSGGWGGSNNYNEFVAKSDYSGANGLFKKVNDNIGSNTFVSLAHPNSSDYGNLSNIAYNSFSDAAISVSAVENGPSTSTNTTYSNPASSMGYLSYYKKLLSKGYHVAPSIDHDNHNTTFGRTTYSRSAVVAPALTRTEIIKGFRNMHVYATQDCDTKVDFTLNTLIMGSSLTASGAPVIAVTITDATTSTTAAIIKIMFGQPGSNVTAVEIFSTTGSSLKYVDNSLPNLATGYYYIDITNGSSRIVTAPVWYTRLDNGVLPVSFGMFTVQKLSKAVKLNWSTLQETNSSHFIIERSADGRNWTSILTTPAAGNSNQKLAYTAYDNLPLNGTGYYRIKQVDRDNKFQVSVVRNVRFDAGYMISMAPNPAKDVVTITMEKKSGFNSTIQIFDAAGNVVYAEKTNLSSVNIKTARFNRGLYFVKIATDNQVATQKLLLQ